MVVHLFFALTMSIRWRLLFPTLCGSVNTKSMVLQVTVYVMRDMDTHDTASLVHKFKVTQRAIERAMLGVALQVRIRNEVIRRRTKVDDDVDGKDGRCGIVV
jgi:hypothetical protein